MNVISDDCVDRHVVGLDDDSVELCKEIVELLHKVFDDLFAIERLNFVSDADGAGSREEAHFLDELFLSVESVPNGPIDVRLDLAHNDVRDHQLHEILRGQVLNLSALKDVLSYWKLKRM